MCDFHSSGPLKFRFSQGLVLLGSGLLRFWFFRLLARPSGSGRPFETAHAQLQLQFVNIWLCSRLQSGSGPAATPKLLGKSI